MPQGMALNSLIYGANNEPIDFMTIAANKSYERILGLKRPEIVLKRMANLHSLTTPEPIDWVKIYGKVALTGNPDLFELYSKNRNRYYQVYVNSLVRGYCIAVFVDITAQRSKSIQESEKNKKIEARLKESAEKYQYLAKYAPTGIYEIDYDTQKFTSVNDSMCKILGYSRKELLKMSPMDLLFEESRIRFSERIAVVAKGKGLLSAVEYHVKTKDGLGLWAILNVKFTRKNGRFHSVLVVAHDITERKKAEQAAISAEKRYRRLYETTHDGIMARDLEGKMIHCNQAYAKMLGYTKTELRNLTVRQLLPERWHKQRDEVVNKVLQTGRSILFEREYKRKDGSIFSASVRTWRLTDGKGKVIGIWSIVRDITHQKMLQKELEKQTELLESILAQRTKQLKDSERLAAIGQTAAMVGHDLRNPLQTITGELYLAKDDIASLENETMKHNLQENIRIIEEQAIYMDKIVSDLQAFVQPVKIEKNPVNLQALVRAVLAVVPIPANVKVSLEIRNISTVKGDFQLLKRVLINLVTNAVQAMPQGGQLHLKAQVNSNGQVLLKVKDTGVGIAENIRGQIFTPLFTTKPRGQGFGLAVCKRVIEAHGGTIDFKSEVGKGAEFTLMLPAS